MITLNVTRAAAVAALLLGAHLGATDPARDLTPAQAQKNGLFIFAEPFAFMAFGPSNLAERPLAAGTVLRERYTVTIEDLRTSETK